MRHYAQKSPLMGYNIENMLILIINFRKKKGEIFV